jgi:chemotaxis protein methyltransferase CheR
MTLRPKPTARPQAAAIDLIGALLEQRTGQRIDDHRSWRIEAALKPLLREHALEDFDALARALRSARDPSLVDRVVESLLNHETSFFRDAGVLEQVAAVASARADSGLPLRIWSAGCATGQEPISLAMLFAERGGQMPDIHATDVSDAVLRRARAGRYTQFEIQRGLPIGRLVRWFEADGGDWIAKTDLVDRIRYRRHNLTRDPALPGRFDVILCRNVLLYFESDVRRRVLDGLAGALRPGGLILLGAGETVIGQCDRLTPSRTWRGFYEAAAEADGSRVA